MTSKETPLSARSALLARNQSDVRSKIEAIQTDCGVLQARNAFLEKEVATLRLADEKRAAMLVEVLKHVDVIEKALHSLNPSEQPLINQENHLEYVTSARKSSKFYPFVRNSKFNTHHASPEPESPVFRNKNRKFSLQHPNQLVRDGNFVMPMTIPEWKESVHQANSESAVHVRTFADGASSKDQLLANAAHSIKEVRRVLSDKDYRKPRTNSAPHTPSRPTKRGSVLEQNYVDLAPSTSEPAERHNETKKSGKTKEHATGKAPYEQAAVFFCEIT
ncbi:hypothetical protein RvY_04367 [Ramazzottius varieornatus]|uniref:Uncharacterized protein n=1 Tax=Ramazzottius varieornatus TaxID=947166 RepID=A0A1D1URE0_RAMVA|nr:hypothetical protein RvY_04367 [Ramazzottius varieornatus]